MSTNLPEQQPSEEIDLGQLFKLIGNAFDRLFRFIGSIFNRLFLAFVWVVFFTKKHILKIGLAAIIGVALGFAKQKTETPVYISTVVIKQNYFTGEHLTNTIEYYNSLFKQKDSVEAAKLLRIKPGQSLQITELEMKSNLTENLKLQLFDEYIQSLDSVLAKTVKYKDFIENMKDYDYNIQKLTLKSYSKSNFSNVITNIIENIEESEFFKNERDKQLDDLNKRDSVIIQSLKESQVLQTVYKKVLEKPLEELPSGATTSITVGGVKDNNVTKEYELYSNDLVLRREMVENEADRKDLERIIEIVSIQDGNGTLQNNAKVFGIETSWLLSYGVKLALVVFLILLLLEFMKFLEPYKDKV